MKTLLEMEAGQRGEVSEIIGGQGFRKKLEALGIFEGRVLEKISQLKLKGPVVLRIDRAQVAIGCESAKRIKLSILE